MLLTLAVVIISFLVGFAMKRGGLCTYAAAVQIVQLKRLELMLIFLGATAWATLIILPLSWTWPNLITLSQTHHQLTIAVIGGAILGLGAFFNKGCFFGTFVQLVSGNLNYLATLVGLSAGILITHLYLNNLVPTTLVATDVTKPTPTGFLWLFGMGVFALLMALSIRLSGNNIIQKLIGLCKLSWQNSFAMMIIGIGGGLLYATVSGWNYADVLANSMTTLINNKANEPSLMAITSTTAMVTGGVIAAITAKEFAIRPAHFWISASCFIGGMFMGIAAQLTPGGNDGMLLKGIPSLAPHAIIGYLMMVTVMLVLVYLFRRKN